MESNRAHLQLWLNRHETTAVVSCWCPFCSATLERDVNPIPQHFPVPPTQPWRCPVCGADIWVTIAGWLKNPTGDRPAVESPLSDYLPALEGALSAPAAYRREPSPPKAPNPLLLIRSIADKRNDPENSWLYDEDRRTLRQWGQHLSGADSNNNQIAAMLQHLTPATIAAAYRRLYEREPEKIRQTTTYESLELLEIWDAYLNAQQETLNHHR